MAGVFAARRGAALLAGTALTGYGARRYARAEEGDAPVALDAPAPSEPPKPPGIYDAKGGFDPGALEAVAALLKETGGKSDLSHARAAAVETQAEEKKKADEYRAYGNQLRNEARQAQRAEEEKTRAHQREHGEQRSRYATSLQHERAMAAQRLEEALKDGEEGERAEHETRLEDLRKETALIEAELRRETDAAYLAASHAARAAAERTTQDLRLDSIKEKAKVARDTALEAVKATFSSLGGGANALLGDEKRMAAIAGVITATALGVFVARKSTSVLGTYVEARLRKPALVRETSRGYALASSAFGSGRAGAALSRATSAFSSDDSGALMDGIVFEKDLEARLGEIAKAAANTRKNKAPFRHCLFHGPPGTGKTLFAKKLAKHAGLDFAICSGGDVAPLGRDAVTEIHKLFDWAKASPRGVVLLIDEAEAFVRKRDRNMSEDARNALNAFLYRTGSPNADVMVVFATNAPELFDRAIHDRVDETVFFDLPGEAERLKILKEAVEAMVAEKPPASWWRPPPATVKLDEAIDDAAIRDAAARTEGLSAREVAKLALAWQANALASEGARLTRDLFEETIESQKAQTMLKREWKALERGKKRPKAH